MQGKYSPTIVNTYRLDQNWHKDYAQGLMYDPEGYDSYGYNKEDMDRAGNKSYEYLYEEHKHEGLYDYVLDQWRNVDLRFRE